MISSPRNRTFLGAVLAACLLLTMGLAACGGSSDSGDSAKTASSPSDFPSAEGKTIQELQAEAEAAHEFDIQELFDDIGGAADEDGPLPTR